MDGFLSLIQHEVHIAALLFMGIAYILRIVWLMRFKAGIERTMPAGGNPGAAVAGSMLAVAKPWTIEGTRRHPMFYVQFAAFHLGAAAAISMTFLIPYQPELLRCGRFVGTMQAILGAAFIAGMFRLYRRLSDSSLRLVSTPDDYFALIMMNLFYAAGIGAISGSAFTSGKWPLAAFFLMAAFFHFYVPFSKIIHYLYYPFTRYYLGKTMGHRNIGNGRMNIVP